MFRLPKFFERRSTSSRDPSIAHVLGMRSGASGQYVSEESALQLSGVHACVQLISESIASLPLMVHQRTEDGGRQADRDHPLHTILNEQSNETQTAMEFREQLIASVLLHGNGYALKEINRRGDVTALMPLEQSQVRPEKLINGRIRYLYTPSQGNTLVHSQDEVLHIRYRSRNGIVGLSPIQIAAETIGVGLAQQKYESSLFKNGARLCGALKHPMKLGPEAAQTLKNSFNDEYSGSSNAYKVLVLEEGMEYQSLAMSQRDAEFIEGRKLTLEDIARIYRVPPPSIGILDNATYSNITEQSRMLVMHCLRPWMVRIEKAMNASLLTSDGRRSHFLEHNAEGLLRGSMVERFEGYRIAREWGWMSVNEIRRIENMNGVGSEGDTYRQPMNSEKLGVD